jgi:hypothetical protein
MPKKAMPSGGGLRFIQSQAPDGFPGGARRHGAVYDEIAHELANFKLVLMGKRRTASSEIDITL